MCHNNLGRLQRLTDKPSEAHAYCISVVEALHKFLIRLFLFRNISHYFANQKGRQEIITAEENVRIREQNKNARCS